ncbi:MAG TPA: sensor domain-containing protein [Thermoanaerobaculia bacterium]|nr:sensor domain-containing protein [Thermoanaerobaculia bacterium]
MTADAADPEKETSSYPGSFPSVLAGFVRAPFRLRTYTNLLFLALAFPLGLIYFVFLTVGLPLGYGLIVVWVGIPILALVFAGSWWMSALERQLAIRLLGAEVPPMAPPPGSETVGFWQRVRTFLSNPVTWKGMAYLLLKLPMGIASFTATVTLLSFSFGLMLAPIVWPWTDLRFEIDFGVWQPGTFGDALLCGLVGVVFTFLSLNLLNGLAFVWRWVATWMLGSPRFVAPATPAAPPPPLSLEAAPATA